MLKTERELNELNELYLNENMSISNMPAIMVPMPPPLVRQMCYLPEHYPPFASHSNNPNCPCSFCLQKRFSVSMKEVKVAIKELPQIDLLESKAEDTQKLRNPILAQKKFWEEEEILLEPEEEILLQPVTRSLCDFPIPVLSRSTNDPSTWEPADDEEIVLGGL
jgi:hypothetical protein